MSIANGVRATAEVELLADLSRLARKGAYAVPKEAGAGTCAQFAVFSPRNDYARPIATISEASVAVACSRGWLVHAQDDQKVQLAPAGARALRRSRSAAGTPARGQRRNAKPHAREHPPLPMAVVAKQEGPLSWLRRRKDKDGRPLLSEAQFAAGERLCSDYWRGQLTPRVTADWSGSASSKRTRRAGAGVGIVLSDGALAARERVYRAVKAVGPELGSILVDVCCHEMGLEGAAREHAWPARTTKVVLGIALTSLARHYGLIAPEPSAGVLRLRHWGEEGYRPGIEAWR